MRGIVSYGGICISMLWHSAARCDGVLCCTLIVPGCVVVLYAVVRYVVVIRMLWYVVCCDGCVSCFVLRVIVPCDALCCGVLRCCMQ